MPRGEHNVTKVHYSGSTDDFVVFVESESDLKNWMTDRSIPLAQVVSAFEIFTTHKQGAQGELNRASKSTLENEFGTKNEDEAIIKILEGGKVQQVTNPGRMGDRNDTKGPMNAHGY